MTGMGVGVVGGTPPCYEGGTGGRNPIHGHEYLRSTVDPSPILRYLADLAASTATTANPAVPDGATPETLDLTRSRESAEWLGTSLALPLVRAVDAREGTPTTAAVRRTDRVRRLAALDALQPTEHLLRLGWVVVSGTITVEDRKVTYCFPLVSQAVRLSVSLLRQITVVPRGAPELTPLVTDAEAAGRLEATAEYGGGAPHPPRGRGG